MVTGGSMGIGGGVRAGELARKKARLFPCWWRGARRSFRALAASLAAAHGVTVEVIAEDLARPGAPRRVHE